MRSTVHQTWFTLWMDFNIFVPVYHNYRLATANHHKFFWCMLFSPNHSLFILNCLYQWCYAGKTWGDGSFSKSLICSDIDSWENTVNLSPNSWLKTSFIIPQWVKLHVDDVDDTSYLSLHYSLTLSGRGLFLDLWSHIVLQIGNDNNFLLLLQINDRIKCNVMSLKTINTGKMSCMDIFGCVMGN